MDDLQITIKITKVILPCLKFHRKPNNESDAECDSPVNPPQRHRARRRREQTNPGRPEVHQSLRDGPGLSTLQRQKPHHSPTLAPPHPSPSHQRLETGALRSDLLPKRLISRTASFMQESMFTLDLTRLRAAALHVKGKVMRPRPVSRMHARRPQTRAAAPAVHARSTRNKN